MRKLEPKKSRLGLMLILLALVVLAMVLIKQSSHKVTTPFSRSWVKSGGDTLDIAIELNPNIYRVVGDSISGRDYELLQNISRRHGVPMKFHPFVPLRHAMEGLDQGIYDILVASMPMTSNLRDYFLMTDPVYLDREILVQRLDSVTQMPKVTSQIELGGDTVWIAHSSPIAERINNLSAEIGDTIYIMSDPRYTAEHLIIMVNYGLIRLAVVNESVAKAMKKDYPYIDISTPVSFTQFQSWAVNKENHVLCDSLNSWLQ